VAAGDGLAAVPVLEVAMTDTLCVVPHHHDPERPRRALDGLLVCAGHEAGLSRWLRQLAPLHAVLEYALATGDLSGGPVVSGTRDVGLDLRTQVSTVRDAIRHKLATWALMVAEEAKATAPDLSPEARPAAVLVPRRRKYNVINPRTGKVEMITRLTAIPREVTEVQVLTDWLTTWHPWLLAQAYVDDWAQDLADLHSVAWSCAYPSGRTWHVVADCPAAGCGGRLRATVGSWDELLPDRVICTDDPDHTWMADTWRALRKTLPGRQEWLTMAALSQLHGVALSTLYRWATEDRWQVRRWTTVGWVSVGRPSMLYCAEEVDAAVTARRAALDERPTA
jgi:hypothetical protein